jgi:hypothetical protein
MPLAADVDFDPTPWVQVICFRPAGLRSPAFEDSVRQAVSQLGGFVRFTSAPPGGGYRAGVWVSPSQPTLVVMVDGHMTAQGVGVLPRHELDLLLTAALRR